MDLDQLISDADPARGLEIAIPAPTHTAAHREHRAWAGRIVVALSVAIAVGVAGVALMVLGHRSTATTAIPSRLPFSATALVPGAGVLGRSAGMVQVFPDPDSGPGWGMRIVNRTRKRLTCVWAGRTESGLLGAIGIDGAFGDDLRFHPFARGDAVGALGGCAPPDAHGHAFINIDAVNTEASAGMQPCIRHDDALPREHCPADALRDVYFGLLGPDAVSITYVVGDGKTAVQRTRGRDGAYLVVTPVAQGSCNRQLMRRLRGPGSCNYDASGEGIGPTLGSGEITAVHYRDGSVCRLPAPHGVIVPLAQCPVVGYVSAPGPKYTATQIAASVAVRKLPARYYCQRKGAYRPDALAIPCDGAIPRGYARFDFAPSRNGHPGYEPGQNLLVYISWTAHGIVKNPQQSSYYISITYPKGCGAGGGGRGTETRIRPGQRVTRYFYVPTNCRGSYTGQVTYIPDLGPGGNSGGIGLAAASARSGSLLVGNFTFTIP